MQELLWIVVGALSAYIVWQLGRYVVLSRGSADDTEPDAASPTFRSALDTSALRREMDELRETVAQQQLALDALSRGMEGVREQVESFSAPRTAPEYDEALICARRGFAADAIAERCGISVAEAELLRSLAGREKAG